MTDDPSQLDREAIVLVDEHDEPVGYADKMQPHLRGDLHRAFSIFLFNRHGQILLQKRAASKYHFGGLWSNTCCSHPRRDEAVIAAAGRRLKDELGIQAELKPLFTFIYRARDPASGLTEHELDHVLVGQFDGELRPNPQEVSDVRWQGAGTLKDDLAATPDRYTPWLRAVLDRLLAHPATRPLIAGTVEQVDSYRSTDGVSPRP